MMARIRCGEVWRVNGVCRVLPCEGSEGHQDQVIEVLAKTLTNERWRRPHDNLAPRGDDRREAMRMTASASPANLMGIGSQTGLQTNAGGRG